MISFKCKCVGSRSCASLGVAPGFPAPPGHLWVLSWCLSLSPSWTVCVRMHTVCLCLCESANERVSQQQTPLSYPLWAKGTRTHTPSIHLAPTFAFFSTHWVDSSLWKRLPEKKQKELRRLGANSIKQPPLTSQWSSLCHLHRPHIHH